MKKIVTISLLVASATLFTACTGSAIDLSKQTPSFQAGSKDGCSTANGEYMKKSGDAWKHDTQYQDGWYHGRKTCNPQNAS